MSYYHTNFSGTLLRDEEGRQVAVGGRETSHTVPELELMVPILDVCLVVMK